MTIAKDEAIELGRPGAELRGVAGDGRSMFAAIRTGAAASEIRSPAWHTALDGVAGPIAYASGRVITTLAVAGHGEPGAQVVALDAATGAVQWRVALDSTELAVIVAIAATPDGIVVGGTFAGTIRASSLSAPPDALDSGRASSLSAPPDALDSGRATDRVVASAGRTDGFVARLALDGKVAWLVRIGGEGADGIAGVALAKERVAIAGTFAAGADLLGQDLHPIADAPLLADAFVAELDRDGHRMWASSFGSAADDHVAGVAIDARDRVVVAAIARGTVHLGGTDYVARGAADGLVAWFSPQGAPGPATLLGGGDFDGLRAICAIDERVVVGGFFSGTMRVGTRDLVAGGGDDAFLVALDDGKVVASWPITGAGREEIVALAPLAGGFVAGIAHTAAVSIGASTLASPADPMAGFGVVVRGL